MDPASWTLAFESFMDDEPSAKANLVGVSAVASTIIQSTLLTVRSGRSGRSVNSVLSFMSVLSALVMDTTQLASIQFCRARSSQLVKLDVKVKVRGDEDR
jgi:hypothetical protein